MLNILCFLMLSALGFVANTFAGDKINGDCINLGERIYSSHECYTVISELGEGAFGCVYAVKDSKGAQFAIKIYKSSDTQSNKFFELLADAEREFQRGQLFVHPHIIKSYDLFSSYSPSNEMRTNLVLEFVDGKALYERKKGTFSFNGSIAAVSQFIDALQYAWSLNFVHLDLHEGNLMIDKDDNLKIIDLASFYSFEELFSFVQDEIEKNTQITTIEKKQISTSLKAMVISSASHLPKLALDPIRANKINQFFHQNPALFNQLKQINEYHQSSLVKESMMLKSHSNHINQSLEKETIKHLYYLPMQSYYFDRVTEMCIKLIAKSDLKRQNKITLRAEIKKIAWNHEEDLEEGTLISLENYLDQIRQIIREVKP